MCPTQARSLKATISTQDRNEMVSFDSSYELKLSEYQRNILTWKSTSSEQRAYQTSH